MCLAVPSKIVRFDEFTATVDVNGARRDVSLMLMPEPVGLGDYVLVHAGFAIQRVSHDDAISALETINEVLSAEDEGRLPELA